MIALWLHNSNIYFIILYVYLIYKPQVALE